MIKTYTKKSWRANIKSLIIGPPVFELLKGIKSSIIDVERTRLNDSTIDHLPFLKVLFSKFRYKTDFKLWSYFLNRNSSYNIAVIYCPFDSINHKNPIS